MNNSNSSYWPYLNNEHFYFPDNSQNEVWVGVDFDIECSMLLAFIVLEVFWSNWNYDFYKKYFAFILGNDVII